MSALKATMGDPKAYHDATDQTKTNEAMMPGNREDAQESQKKSVKDTIGLGFFAAGKGDDKPVTERNPVNDGNGTDSVPQGSKKGGW